MAVNSIAEQMGLENAKAAHARFEQVLFDIPTFITSKAVGKIKPILECLNVESESYFLFFAFAQKKKILYFIFCV